MGRRRSRRTLAPHGCGRKGSILSSCRRRATGQIYGPGRVDGPFPEHYEPAETPVNSHPFSKQLHNPCMKVAVSDMDVLAKPADPRFPFVLTTYGVTEQWCGGGDTRNTPVLLEAEPQLYVEMSPELAKAERHKERRSGRGGERAGQSGGYRNGYDPHYALQGEGKTVHLVGMPFCFGWTTPGVGDATNRLLPSVARPQRNDPRIQGMPG